MNETFACYTNVNNADGSAAVYVGQAIIPIEKSAFTLDAAKIAKAKAESARVAALCGWSA